MKSYESKINLCKSCKRCCHPEGVKICLTPRDIFAIAYEKKIPITHVLLKYCDVSYDGPLSIVSLKENENGCVFRKNKKCSLIRKIDMCAAFPYGGTLWFKDSLEDVVIECQEHPNFIDYTREMKRIFTHPGAYEEYKKICLQDPFFQKWMQVTSICGGIINGLERESERLDATELAFHLLYGRYDTSKNFIMQFDRNVLELIKYLG